MYNARRTFDGCNPPLEGRVTRKLVAAIALFFICGFAAMAQEQPAQEQQQTEAQKRREERRRREEESRKVPVYDVSGAFLYRSYYPSFPATARFDMVGWDGSADYSLFRRWLSIAGEVNGTYGDQTVNISPVEKAKTGLYTFAAGPRVYPFGHAHKLTVYAHGLFGGGYVHVSIPPIGGFNAETRTDTSRVLIGGAGLTWRFRPHWDIRVIQLDYEATRFFVTSGVAGQANYRVSVGISYRLGEKLVKKKS
jgi:hypothetical protein